MMKDDLRSLLQSERPSQRSVAIDRLRREATSADVKLVRAAMTAETVPALRRQLLQIVRGLDQTYLRSEAPVAAEAENLARMEDDFIHWMRHELEPGLGWLSLAASDEVPEYETSETRAAIDGLAKRLDSVEALVRASAPPRYEPVSLSEVLQEAIRMSRVPDSRVALDVGTGGADSVTSDPKLLRLVLSNAIRNGYEAVLELTGGDSQVYVASGVTPETFWVKISNRFSGSEFSLDEISGRGVSAKIGHQGQGFGIMRIVAARLGYELQMEAEAGLAVFTLRGRRAGG